MNERTHSGPDVVFQRQTSVAGPKGVLRCFATTMPSAVSMCDVAQSQLKVGSVLRDLDTTFRVGPEVLLADQFVWFGRCVVLLECGDRRRCRPLKFVAARRGQLQDADEGIAPGPAQWTNGSGGLPRHFLRHCCGSTFNFTRSASQPNIKIFVMNTETCNPPHPEVQRGR